jgi:phosphoribosylformylglycinamidine synthase PurS subunit
MRVRIEVFLKPGVLDVQGKAVESALHGLGWRDVKDVRVGRLITLEATAGERGQAEADATAMCDKLLANPVIENYRVTVE